MPMDRTARGILISFASYLAFSFSDASVKLIQGGLPPYESAFFGSLFGLAVLPFVRRRGEPWTDIFATSNVWLWLVRFLISPASVIGSVVAFTHLPMAEAMALMFLLPVHSIILARLLLGERSGPARWAAVLVGLLGVLVALRPGLRELSIGHLGALVTGITGALKVMAFRAGRGRENSLALFGACLLGGIVVCGLLALPELVAPSPAQWAKLASYGLLAAVGNVLTMRATRLTPAAWLGPTQYSQILWALLFGYVLFGDTADGPMLLGLVLIAGSGLLTLLPRRTGA